VICVCEPDNKLGGPAAASCTHMYLSWKKLMTCRLSLSDSPCLSEAFLACMSLALVRAWLDKASRIPDKMKPFTTAKPLQNRGQQGTKDSAVDEVRSLGIDKLYKEAAGRKTGWLTSN